MTRNSKNTIFVTQGDNQELQKSNNYSVEAIEICQNRILKSPLLVVWHCSIEDHEQHL
jgi:hypothetical protein